jgi:nicotinamide riboside transporter PnuC
MKMTDKCFVAVALVLTTAMLWLAIFHTSGHTRVMMLIYAFFMPMTIHLKLFQSKRRKEGKEIRSAVFRRGTNKRPVVIGAVLGALLWWLAFRFLPHSH